MPNTTETSMEKCDGPVWPECEEFYNLMQAYRHINQRVFTSESLTVIAYERVKDWLRKDRTILENDNAKMRSVLIGLEEFLRPRGQMIDLRRGGDASAWHRDIKAALSTPTGDAK